MGKKPFEVESPYFPVFKLKEQPQKIRLSQIWKYKYPFFGSRHPPFMAGGGTPTICTKVAPPTPGPQEGGGGIMLLKNRSGVRVPLIFGSGGYHPGLAGGGTPNGPGITLGNLLKKFCHVCEGNF